jgi:ATP-binding cassette subfamily B protein
MSPPPPETSRPRPNWRERLRVSFAHSGRAMALVWQSSRGATLAVGALTVASALLPPVVAYVGKLIVDAVVAAQGVPPGSARDAAVDRVLGFVLFELGAVVTMALVERALSLARELLGARLGVDVNLRILEKALTLDLHHFENPEVYDKLTRARREASGRPLWLVMSHFVIARGALNIAGYLALLLRFAPWMVAALLATTVPAFIAEARFSSNAFRMRNWRSPDARRLNYLEYVLANDEHAKEVKLFGLGPLLRDRYRALAEAFFRQDRSLAIRRAGWGWALSLLSTGAFYGCYALIVLAAVRGRLSLGDMTLYLVAFRQAQQSFQNILGAVGEMYENSLYMTNLFDFFAIPTGRATRPQPAAVRTEEGIRFEGVGFRYRGSDKWALRGVDVFIPRGQSLALVGENGAGKTTFVKLLTRLYEPTEGRVLLDGRDLADWDEPALRHRIGVIFQDFNQYQLLVRENVGFGSVEHVAEDLRVQRAVEQGGARDLVATLTKGLDTQLGRWFKDGVELSGGQWQKVALARAFMREEADVLILDEPTAALDAEAEHAVFQRFRALSHGRTTIVISHRFPTVRMADRILVLEQGRVIEAGTHDELLAAGARYARLFTLQAEGYR